MIFCLGNKKISIYFYYTFRYSSWPRKRRYTYNPDYFSFLEAYRDFKATDWYPDNKGIILPGIKICIESFYF